MSLSDVFASMTVADDIKIVTFVVTSHRIAGYLFAFVCLSDCAQDISKMLASFDEILGRVGCKYGGR